MRTIIHIGQHKTGTTSLQHYLKDNQNQLLDQHIYYPIPLAGNDSPSHYLLNLYSLADEHSSPMKDKLLNTNSSYEPINIEKELKADIKKHYAQANKRKCTDIIWSNEGLYLLNSIEEYEKLIKLFKPYSDEIVCVCTFREKKAFIDSYTKHLFRQGLSLSTDEKSYRFVEPSSWLIDYERKQYLLEQVFKDIIYIPYDPEDMINNFMTHIGIKTPVAPTQRLNVSN